MSLLDRIQSAKFWSRAEELPEVQPTADTTELCGLLRELIEIEKEKLEVTYLTLKAVSLDSFNNLDQRDAVRAMVRKQVGQL